MKYTHRLQEERIRKALRRNRSVLLLGARQTGKTTLIHRLQGDMTLSLVRPDVRQRYEKNPALLTAEVEALERKGETGRTLVLLDEVQKVPLLLDVVQDLIDRGRANFVLTGSSARKLRRGQNVNLLPGRVAAFHLDPFTFSEMPGLPLRDYLLYGSLPGILASEDSRSREADLESYVTVYLEEEVRAEAIVRKIGPFARFLEYAASESGQVVNLRRLSQEIGVSHTTIGSYYQILEDCLVAERVEPLTHSRTRKKLTKAQKYLFFDLGVRRLAAREGTALSRESYGRLLEQWVGLELIRSARLSEMQARILFWRDPDGPEVDWVIERAGRCTPVEVKWTDQPLSRDARHLQIFLEEYPSAEGYLVCQVPRRMKLGDKIFAVPWQETGGLVYNKGHGKSEQAAAGA